MLPCAFPPSARPTAPGRGTPRRRRRSRRRPERTGPGSAWSPPSGHLVGRFRGVERRGEALLLAVIARSLPEAGPADAGRAVAAQDVALRVLTQHVVKENVLGDDDVALHSHHLGDMGD